MFKVIFWNYRDHRLRAFWRIIFQFGLMFFLNKFVDGPIPKIIYAAVFTATTNQVISAFMNLAVILISLVFAGYFLDCRDLPAFGFHFSKKWFMDLVFGLAIGAGLMGIIFLVEWAAGWVTITDTFVSQELPVPVSFMLAGMRFVFVGIYEETYFRGYLMRNMAEGLNFKWIGPKKALLAAALLSSSVFGFAHLTNPNANWVSTVNIILGGIFLGFGFLLTGDLGISIGIHIAWNFFQGNVLGFPVSGNSMFTRILVIQQSGPDIWTGGAFGPEGGIIGLLAVVLGCGLIAGWVHATRGRLTLETGLAGYNPADLQFSEPGTECIGK